MLVQVAAIAIGTLARTNIAVSAATAECANGTMIPTNSPKAIPRGTERRLKRHKSERSTRWAKGRMKRFFSSCSRVGKWPRSQFVVRETRLLIRGPA